MDRPPRSRLQLGEAWRAIRALIADPDDTEQVFVIIRALSGPSIERSFDRFVKSEHGPRILAEKRSLADRLNDRDSLLALREGSLGRVYAEFMDRERIDPQGLIDASEAAVETGSGEIPDQSAQVSPERELFAARLRDMHDLWHVVTGYGRDLVGEAALLAFTFRQTRNRGIGFIIAVAYLRAGRELPEERRMIRDGFRRARGTAWLPAADWESLLERPLDEVRERLGVVPAEGYEECRSEGAPALV